MDNLVAELPSVLTRAEVRDEVRAALACFAEEVLRRELRQLGDAVCQDLRNALQEQLSLDALKGVASQPPTSFGGAEQSVFEEPEKPAVNQEPSTLPSVLDSVKSTATTAVPGVLSPLQLAAADFGSSVGSRSPATSPVQSPFPSPLPSPHRSPILVPMSPNLAGGSRKDWRRTFVEKACKANRKVEYLQGYQCRETYEVADVIDEALKALEGGVKPDLVEDGLGGTYFVKDRSGNSIAVFKPRDEEPLAPNNPKEHPGGGCGAGLKDGVLVGEAALNEYASFLIDQMAPQELRAGAPPTALVRMADSVFHSAKEDPRSAFRKVKDKVGSFQLFAAHDCTSEDLGPSRFPTDLVHRLAVFDIRICNTDRHAGNILIRETDGQAQALIPIDHGYALPGEVGGATFEWLSWPAAKKPFAEEIRLQIMAIDPEAVEAKLRKRVPVLRPACLATLRICTLLLQRGVEAGLTAHDIGNMMCRPDCGSNEPRSRSQLEEIVAEANGSAKTNDGDDFFELKVFPSVVAVSDASPKALASSVSADAAHVKKEEACGIGQSPKWTSRRTMFRRVDELLVKHCSQVAAQLRQERGESVESINSEGVTVTEADIAGSDGGGVGCGGPSVEGTPTADFFLADILDKGTNVSAKGGVSDFVAGDPFKTEPSDATGDVLVLRAVAKTDANGGAIAEIDLDGGVEIDISSGSADSGSVCGCPKVSTESDGE